MARHHKSSHQRKHPAGRDPRRHLEREESHMIGAGQHDFANMPQHITMKEWPSDHVGMPEDLDDSIRGIDRQMGEDNSRKHKNLSPHKW